MRKIEVIFSEADKELTEKLCHRHEKLADRYLALAIIFKIITWIALSVMFAFITGAAWIALSAMFAFITGAVVKNSLYYIAVAGISLMSAIALFLISVIFQMIHDDHFANALHYWFMLEHMQEILKYEDSLAFSVSKTCPNAVIYNLLDGRYRCIKTVNNIPADGDVIITVKEDTNSKGQISLDWYAKAV